MHSFRLLFKAAVILHETFEEATGLMVVVLIEVTFKEAGE